MQPMHGGPETPSGGSLGTAVTGRRTPPHARRDVLRRRRDGGWLVKASPAFKTPSSIVVLTQQFSHSLSPLSQHIATRPSLLPRPASMEAPMRRDFEALDRSEAAEAAMAEAKEWDRVVAEAVEGREKYRGVRKVPSGKYAAEIRDPETGRQVWLGTYAAAFLAACAYDIAARSLQGRRAKPNFAYPPPPLLVSAVAATPRRRGHAYPAPQAPAPFVGHFSSQAPAVSEPAAYQSPHVPEYTKIAAIRLIPLRSFSFEATAVDSGRFNDPVNLIAPPMHMEAPESLAKTCFSSTVDHELKDSAASSSSRPRSLMLKKPKVSVLPTTTTPTTTTADGELTGDNFTGVPVPPSAPMPIDLNAAP